MMGVAKKKVYITLHSYGQYILVPWGYTYDYPPHFKKQVGIIMGVHVNIKNMLNTVF